MSWVMPALPLAVVGSFDEHNPFRYFNRSPEVIRLVVMMYVRYPLSLRNVLTDGLCSYSAAMNEIGVADRHEVGGRLNNRAEWVPDPAHEAIRDPVRPGLAAVRSLLSFGVQSGPRSLPSQVFE